MPHPSLLSLADSALLVIDIQEKLVPFLFEKEKLLHNVNFLLDVAETVRIPVLATEQYPKGLGSTVPELAARLPNRPEKLCFSCAIPEIVEQLHREARPKVVLAGIESHVCVQHTALDLLAEGFRVYVAADAVSSRYAIDHEYALRRMEKAGAILVTVETVAFELLGRAGSPEFKVVSKLVQERMKQLG
jgi:nicotinamidase-related amidase